MGAGIKRLPERCAVAGRRVGAAVEPEAGRSVRQGSRYAFTLSYVGAATLCLGQNLGTALMPTSL